MLILRRVTFVLDFLAYTVLVFIPFYVMICVIEIFNTSNISIILFNMLLLIIEVIGLTFSYYLISMISGSIFFRTSGRTFEKNAKEEPFFSVIVPSHGTPYSILEQTLIGVLNFDYGNYELIVSDNGKLPDVTKKLRKFCVQNNIDYYHKKDERGFKAGNINAVFTYTKGDYIVILDSDHIPVSNLLRKFVSVIKDPNIGFVQAKVSYRNVNRMYQKANSFLYSQFYEVIEAAKDRHGMVLFNGTTGCFRRSVLEEIGGFAEDTLIEDIDTSMQIIARGYEGRFINFIGSYGLVPASAKAQISQLWRWTHGACNILRIRLNLILSTPHIGFLKKFELILNAMAFFSGISIVFFFSLLALMIYLDVPILRPSFFLMNALYLMPLLVSTSFSIITILTIIWEDKKDHFVIRMLHLIPYYLFSLGSFLFLISGVIEGLLLYNTPKSESSVWDRQFNILRNSLLAILYTGLIVLLTLYSLPNEFSFFILGGTISWVFAPIMLIWEEFFPPDKE